MKLLVPLLLTGALHAGAAPDSGVSFTRSLCDGVQWDQPTDATPATAYPRSGTLIQSWSIDSSRGLEFLADQKITASYLPSAEITVRTLDPEGRIPRTRVDQPFTVEIQAAGLLTGPGMPVSASSVLLERHLANYLPDDDCLDPAAVRSGTPSASGLIRANGITKLRFAASALRAADPTKACGEEHFVIHVPAADSLPHTQLAAAVVQVWPVASATISGISPGETLTGRLPELSLALHDLYPHSDTSLLLFEGTQINGAEGTPIMSFPLNRKTCESHVIGVSDLDAKISANGTYTLALVSETVFGRELLCDPLTFQVERAAPAVAMQSGTP
jgi:hypothetical protein